MLKTWETGSELDMNFLSLSHVPNSLQPPGERNDSPLQYSCLGHPMDRGVWWATVHGVAKSWAHD